MLPAYWASGSSTEYNIFFTLDSGQRLEKGAQREGFPLLGAKVLLFCSQHYINLHRLTSVVSISDRLYVSLNSIWSISKQFAFFFLSCIGSGNAYKGAN